MLFGSREVTGPELRTALPLDRQRAMDLLRPYQSDLKTIRELRVLLGNTPGAHSVSDSNVIQEIVRRIESRDVIAVRPVTASGASKGAAGTKEEEPEPPPARQNRPSSSPASPVELGTTLPSNTNGQAQVAAAQQAAQDGVPFCEH